MCYQVVPQVACSKGCIITLVASIDFSPLCDFKCILKLAGQVDAKLHWLHLFDLSPLCLFKFVLNVLGSEETCIICIDLTFLHCVVSNVISNFLNEQRKTLLCVIKWFLKLPAPKDA